MSLSCRTTKSSRYGDQMRASSPGSSSDQGPGSLRKVLAKPFDEYLARCRQRAEEVWGLNTCPLSPLPATGDSGARVPSTSSQRATAAATQGSLSSGNGAGRPGYFADLAAQGHNQYIVPFSFVVTACVRCNTSVNLLLSQDSARCALFYLSK